MTTAALSSSSAAEAPKHGDRPGGTLVFSHYLPYADAGQWLLWLPEHRHQLPQAWPESGTRRQAANGDELELQVWRIRGFDPAVCLTVLREHFESQAKPASLEALSLPLVQAHRAARREYMGRTDALKLAIAHVRNALCPSSSQGGA